MAKEQRQATAALRKRLTELFETGELRRWILEHFPELKHELPGESASCIEVAHKAVERLECHALIDDDLFDRLIEARERRRGEIDAVRALYPMILRSQALARPRSGHERTWERPHRIAFRSTLALLAFWALTRGYPALDVSRLLRALENSLFSFIPFHRHLALPTLIGTATLCTLLFWLLSLRRPHPLKDRQ